ncbi:MAG: Uncharacterised protein [Rhodothermaeota bacterium MED-G12]|nr:MAG: Uncharacterised protein [Rhodothermaeota bacterium MED-G12]
MEGIFKRNPVNMAMPITTKISCLLPQEMRMVLFVSEELGVMESLVQLSKRIILM